MAEQTQDATLIKLTTIPAGLGALVNRATKMVPSADAQLIIRVLTEFLPRHWKGYALGIVLTSVVSLCTTAVAYLLGQITNQIYFVHSMPGVLLLSFVMVGLTLAKGLADYGQAVALSVVGNRIVAEVEQSVFEKLLRQNIGFFADRHSSEFMTTAQMGGNAIANILRHLVLALGRDLVSLLGLFAIMVQKDPMMSVFGLSVLPVAIFGVRHLMVKADRVARTEFTGAASLQQTMAELVQGFRVVKSFNLEDEVRTRAIGDIGRMEKAGNKLASIANRSAPLIEALGGVGIALMCLYGGYRMLEAHALPGDFVSYLTAFVFAFEPARRIARLNVDLTVAATGARAIFGLLDTPAAEADDSHMPALKVDRGEIELRDVAFAYVAERGVLEDFSLTAPARKTTALVGPSGGGKSTVFNLLLGLYRPSGGNILIDRQDIGSVNRQSLRDAISYMGQDVFLFRGTIRDNIMLGRPGAGEPDMIEAAKAALAHDFITSFPNGYDTQVGELGTQLSTGQRQRIAIARALIKDAPIIILDEPTAALDTVSERHVQEAIRHLCAGRTTLVIAHRLNTITSADRIAVVDRGRIVEMGSHDELLERGGIYRTMIRSQFPAVAAVITTEALAEPVPGE